MIKQLQGEYSEDLKKIKNEVELKIPTFIKTLIMEFHIHELDEKDQAEILKLLNGPKFENSQQFILSLPECLIKLVLKLRKIAMKNINNNPINLSQLLYMTLLPYEDISLQKYPQLGNVIKKTNEKIMDYFETKKQIIRKLKQREIQLLNLESEQNNKKKIIKHHQQDECAKCICKIRQNGSNIQFENQESITLKCQICKEYFHGNCLKTLIMIKIFICPFCQLYYSDPLNKVIDVLLSPQILMVSDNVPEKTLYFECSKEYQFQQIVVKCVLLENGNWMEGFSWPLEGELFLNNQQITHQRQNKMPYVINSFIKFGSMNKITLMLSLLKQLEQLKFTNGNEKTKKVYMLGIYCVEPLITRELIQDLILNQSNHIKTHKSQKQIKKFIQNNLIQTTLKLSLQCQITSKLMKIPGRGKQCKHIQCFDIQSFIMKNQQENQKCDWQCPICSLKCYQLMIDDYQYELVQKINQSEQNNFDIEFDADGQLINHQLRNLNQVDENLMDDMQIEL